MEAAPVQTGLVPRAQARSQWAQSVEVNGRSSRQWSRTMVSVVLAEALLVVWRSGDPCIQFEAAAVPTMASKEETQ